MLSIQEDISFVNIYAPNIGASQYVRQTLTDIKGEINSNIIIVREYNTSLSPMDKSSRLENYIALWSEKMLELISVF